MKNKLLKIALGAAALGATIASADVVAKNAATFKPYAKVTGGFIKPSSTDGLSYRWGGAGHAAFGVAYNEWDIELELGYYRSNAQDNQTDPFIYSAWNALSGMINLIYNYSFTDSIYAYAGAGAGVASVGYKCTIDPATGLLGDMKVGNVTTFAWQLLAGLGYQINANWSIQGGYRLFNTTKANVGSITGLIDLDVKQPFVHNIEVGLKYNF
jgi:opacity protein-like surface antigen